MISYCDLQHRNVINAAMACSGDKGWFVSALVSLTSVLKKEYTVQLKKNGFFNT